MSNTNLEKFAGLIVDMKYDGELRELGDIMRRQADHILPGNTQDYAELLHATAKEVLTRERDSGEKP